MSPEGPSPTAPLRAGGTGGGRARFLFRQEGGTIDAATWRFHTIWLAALAATLTVVWRVLLPYAHHDLKTDAFIAPMTIVAFAYLILYSFALIFIAISYVMLTMKRFRARRAPAGLAGLVPLLALFAASAHFMHSQTPDVISLPYVVALDAALVTATVWTLVELGVRPIFFKASS